MLPAGYTAALVASIEEAFDHLGNHIDIIRRHIRIDPCGAGAARIASHETAWRIVLPTESLGDALAVRSSMFRARRVEQIYAERLADLRPPILAARVVGKTHPFIGACPHIDDAENRRPRLASLGDDRKDDRDLIGSYFGRGNGKRSGEQITRELKTHPANTYQPFVPASVRPRSSCSPSERSLCSRATSAFFTTFQ
jgi:hypothetical protein